MMFFGEKDRAEKQVAPIDRVENETAEQKEPEMPKVVFYDRITNVQALAGVRDCVIKSHVELDGGLKFDAPANLGPMLGKMVKVTIEEKG